MSTTYSNTPDSLNASIEAPFVQISQLKLLTENTTGAWLYCSRSAVPAQSACSAREAFHGIPKTGIRTHSYISPAASLPVHVQSFAAGSHVLKAKISYWYGGKEVSPIVPVDASPAKRIEHPFGHRIGLRQKQRRLAQTADGTHTCSFGKASPSSSAYSLGSPLENESRTLLRLKYY